MEGFFESITPSAVGDLGGWLILVFGVILMGRMFQTGKLMTEAQHLRALEQQEKHFTKLTAALRLAYSSSMEATKASYEARLEERGELVIEARTNLQLMLEIQQTTAEGLADVAQTTKTTERVLSSLETALGLSPVEVDHEAR